MAQTEWTETGCDRCGTMKREYSISDEPNELPLGWTDFSAQRYSLPTTKRRTLILCPDCGDALHEFLVFDTDKAVVPHES